MKIEKPQQPEDKMRQWIKTLEEINKGIKEMSHGNGRCSKIPHDLISRFDDEFSVLNIRFKKLGL